MRNEGHEVKKDVVKGIDCEASGVLLCNVIENLADKVTRGIRFNNSGIE